MKIDLLAALRHLDERLGRAAQFVPLVFGEDAARDPYRGLYVDWDEVQRLLEREPGAPLFPDTASSGGLIATGDEPTLQTLPYHFDLTPFDLDVLLIALAPEIDLRYRRLFAYLQDDVTRKHPTVDLVLHLLCSSPEARLLHRAHFAPGAPLIRHGLLHLEAVDDKPAPPLIARAVRVDEQIINLLLDQPGLDPRLAAFCERITPAETFDSLPLAEDTRRALLALGDQAMLYFAGPADVIKRRAAEALAAHHGRELLAVDVARLLAAPLDLTWAATLILREAWFRDALVFFDDADQLTGGDHNLLRYTLLAALKTSRAGIVLAGALPCPTSEDLLPVEFPPPDFRIRRTCWQTELERAGIAAAPEDIDVLAGHYRLLSGQIAQAVRLAVRQATSRDQIDAEALFQAARRQPGAALGDLAQKIEPAHTWDEIVLPQDALDQLRELCARFAYRQRVMGEWGFDRRLSRGKGIGALFAGPSGTGKTMAAEIIAATLNLDLYRIDLSQVVSKYIGETEKNLSRVFQAAARASAILFFDEADALFGKRTEVRDSHDRYANIEISYLLQQMETYEGISILATNLRQNIDSAFLRRLAFAVHFPFPDENSRRLIWEGIWPDKLPLAGDVDLDFLARQFKLSGGNIKNVALAAAFLAAEDDSPVTMAHLLHATRREFEKTGRMLTDAELNGIRQQPVEGR